MANQESIDILLKAVDLWKKAADNPTEKQYRDTVSLIQLAIKKSSEPLSIGHSMLAQIHFDMDNFGAAWDASEQGLILDPHDYKSQLIRVIIAFAYANEAQGHAQEQRGGLFGVIGGVFRSKGFTENYRAGQKLGEALASGIAPNRLKKLFNEELKKLLAVFQYMCTNGCQASDFLEFASRLTKLADGIYENSKLLDSRVNIYDLIANAPTERIECETEDEQQLVETTQLIAEGRTV